MHPETYRMLAAREESYWWHRARRKMSLDLLRRHGAGPGCKWLDLGCGPGGNLGLLDPLGPSLVAGLDLSPIALGIAATKKPDASLVRADISRMLPFADGAFDVVTIFNVLYHDWVADEASVVREIRRVLRPGGVALVTEPAFRSLSRQMDHAAMGHRRYRRTDVAAWFRNAGLSVEVLSYFTSFGYPILRGAKFLAGFRRNPAEQDVGVDMKRLNAPADRLMFDLASIEAKAIAAGIPVPFGTTIVALGRK
jgi:SAM-dependent methyltransferase